MDELSMSYAMAAMELKSMAVQNSYSASMLKLSMDSAESMAQDLLEMAPAQPVPAVPKGEFIDVYA